MVYEYLLQQVTKMFYCVENIYSFNDTKSFNMKCPGEHHKLHEMLTHKISLHYITHTQFFILKNILYI